ncbi:MAG TPA: pyruvate formate lyase family protein, partial [bacterium]|nr:pyruvate formate lyase family protein [bacterium]
MTGDLRRLREKAREFQARIVGSHYLIVPETRISDAQAWLAHPPEEDWLIWRARRTAARLKVLPIYLEPGELIVGKPLFSPPARYEKKLKEAEKILATIPPFPGGDAGHFHPDYEKVFQIGLGGLEREILFHLGKTSLPADKKIFYQACHIALKGLMAYVHRTGDACLEMAGRDRKNAPHWRRLGRMCCCLARRPPQTFHEAVQLLFLVTIGLWFGDDHGLTSPGRLDRTLYPFYRKDLRAGRLTPRRAFQLLCALFIQYNCILGPGSAVSAMVAGRDSQGKPICNDLTFLSLAARRATGLIYPTVGLAWHKKIRGDLMDFSLRLLSTGNGDPAFFNDEVIVKGLRDHGVSRSDSFNYMNSTCVEIKVCGASNIWVTAPYFNLPKALLEVLADEKIKPATFPEFCRYLRRNLAEKIIKAAADLDAVWQKRALTGCFPLASCFIADCLKRGLDFDRGGARYQWVENSFVGLANLVDGLLAVKHLIYEKKTISRREFARLLENNFQGREPLRRYLLNHLPHYGTDNETADRLAVEWANFLVSTTEKCRVGPHRYVPGFFCWVIHERFGRETGATPDGRLAGWPLSDGAGGSQGRETKGPTASVLSTTKWDHHKVIGGLVQNLKFSANL